MAQEMSSDHTQKLGRIAKEITGYLKSAKGASAKSLEAWRSAGQQLLDAKSLLVHGAYLPWVKETLGISKQWSSNLSKLASYGDVSDEALAWATEKGLVNGAKEYSVEGRLALIRKMEQSCAHASGQPERPKRKTLTEVKKELEAELADTKAALVAKQEEIAALKAELEWVRARQTRSDQTDGDFKAPDEQQSRTSLDGVGDLRHTSVSSSANVQSTGLLDPDISSDESPPALDAVASFDDVQPAVSDEEADQEMEEVTS